MPGPQLKHDAISIASVIVIQKLQPNPDKTT